MNIDKIEVGQIHKSYKALCAALNEKPKTSNSKKAQLKEWECHFSYEKDGNKFIIKEIYKEPLIKIDNRKGGNHKLKHADGMDGTLIHILNNQPDGTLFLTINRLLLEMNMINDNFNFGNRYRQKVSKYLNVQEAYVEEFFNTTKQTYKSNIESMLNRLENKAMIYSYKVRMLCVGVPNNETDEMGNIKLNYEVIKDEYDNEEIKVTTDSTAVIDYRIATDDEIKHIQVVEDEVMIQLDCNSKQEVVVKKLWSKYLQTVNKRLFESHSILFYYDSYKILLNENKIQREAKAIEPLNKKNLRDSMALFNLNQDVQYQLLTNWKKRHLKAVTEKKGKMIRLNKDYVNNGTILIDNFINSNHDNIVDDLKRTKVYS
mgnify:CR=1 FL=1